MTKKKPREQHLWEFDPSLFEPLPKAGIFERYILAPAKTLTKHALYSIVFVYPLILVLLGLEFGGIVFWSSLAGSMLLIWFIIKKSGYAGNFATWDVSYKKFGGLLAAFGMFAALVYGLGYSPLKIWTIPLMFGLFAAALLIGVWRLSNK